MAEYAINPKIDQQVDDFIKQNPEQIEYYKKVMQENPERALRMFALKDVQLDEFKNKERQQYDRYNKAADAVIEEYLSKKENKDIKEKLLKRYESRQLPDEVKHKQMMKDAKLAFELKGVDLKPAIKAELSAQSKAQSKGQKV